MQRSCIRFQVQKGSFLVLLVQLTVPSDFTAANQNCDLKMDVDIGSKCHSICIDFKDLLAAQQLYTYMQFVQGGKMAVFFLKKNLRVTKPDEIVQCFQLSVVYHMLYNVHAKNTLAL